MAKPLTEQTWRSSSEPRKLLDYVSASCQTTERKPRLWAAACVRFRAWHLLQDIRSRDAIYASEQFAEGLVDGDSLRKIESVAVMVLDSTEGAFQVAATAAAWAASVGQRHLTPTKDAVRVAHIFTDLIARAIAVEGRGAINRSVLGIEKGIQADLLRHIFGNPWRPLVSPAHWSMTIIKLAEAQYEGEDCSMALHDALLEVGKNDFAEHFRESFHPRGCAWLDAILGKS